MNTLRHIAYHGTSYENSVHIMCFGFKDEVGSIPNDLGHGIYAYIKREGYTDDPEENAKRYAEAYRNSRRGTVILKLQTVVKEDNILNLNDPENEKILNDFYQKNYDKIEKRIQILYKENSEKPHFLRGNFDGIVLEMFLNNFDINPDAIIMDTFTNYKIIKEYKISNINNGREICIRNKNIIEVISK
ncbi:hypothetical protein T233_01016 [Vagococcus lutrae LBD1]|uniref:Uncharacterized protein n=1 Tax=Vagococcus lutrae LBD1 TaxID=1408226 RepID=V6Q5H9_9ENTE|nr:hypothetical protein [Vagococcus lutrae]EST89910.1 hypothetical protein T233_01016 [Vagococcus lutrae LBD1]